MMTALAKSKESQRETDLIRLRCRAGGWMGIGSELHVMRRSARFVPLDKYSHGIRKYQSDVDEFASTAVVCHSIKHSMQSAFPRNNQFNRNGLVASRAIGN